MTLPDSVRSHASGVMPAPVIAIDGPTASGKGTVAHRVAARLGWSVLDSGALYRLTALAVMRAGIDPDNVSAVAHQAECLDVVFETDRTLLAGADVSADIRQEVIGNLASRIAPHAPVRQALLERQRAFRLWPGLVADGRDMGTVVFPDAPLKIFLTASAEERARRRYLQLKAKGEDVSLPSLLEEIQARDDRDMNRAVAPLKPAVDAVQLDSTEMSIEEVLERILQEAAQRDLLD